MLKQPWQGLTNLEGQGLLVAELAEGGVLNFPALLDVLEAGMDRTSTCYKPVPLPASSSREDVPAFMVGSLEQASLHRDNAVTNLTEAERHFLFLHARSMAEHFIPQISSLSDQTNARVKADLRFAELLEEQVDYASLITAAQVLAPSPMSTGSTRSLQHGRNPCPLPPFLPADGRRPVGPGDILRTDRHWWPGTDNLRVDKGIGLIIDVGGNDFYRGMIATSADEDQGNAVVIDLTGDDTYDVAPLGLATGRLGVGLLIDHAGDDVYQLDMGSGGAGFGGLGILFDGKGNDMYMGSRLTQGAAIGGLGLLFDTAGNDRYTSHAFAIGFGGPLGVGTIIDFTGDDQYGSTGPFYNAGVAWDHSVSMMIDSGNGLDRYTFDRSTGLGGTDYSGWGLFIEEGGADQYHATSGFGDSSEKSVAGFFDLDGNDTYSLPPDSSIPADIRPSD